MADPRDTAERWLADPEALGDPDIRIETESVPGRYVPCVQETSRPVPDICPTGGSWSSHRGRHQHWTLYDTPHERVVIRLPAQPVEDGGDR